MSEASQILTVLPAQQEGNHGRQLLRLQLSAVLPVDLRAGWEKPWISSSGQAMLRRGLWMYVHIPFCRKRCDFCYFRVYTDKNSRDIASYLGCHDRPKRISWRGNLLHRAASCQFCYFGGGTPSYLSDAQLTRLFGGLRQAFPWDEAEEITFECEPGTLTEKKVHAIRGLGVTRLSLGVENFDDSVLEANNRAHKSKEILPGLRMGARCRLPADQH